MPYTKQENRDEYDAWLIALIQDLQEEDFPPGDVTYIMYKIMGHWFKDKTSYQTIDEIRGVLAGVLSEFDRRFAFPYEDEKIIENGDIDWTLPPLDECSREGCAGPADCPCGDPRLGALLPPAFPCDRPADKTLEAPELDTLTASSTRWPRWPRWPRRARARNQRYTPEEVHDGNG